MNVMDLDFLTRAAADEIQQPPPWWAGYAWLAAATLVSFGVSLFLSILTAVIVAAPLRAARGRPWHEQARHAHALRVLLGVQMLLWPMAVLLLGSYWPTPWKIQSLALRCFPPALAALMAATLVRYLGERFIFAGRYTVGQLMRNSLVYLIGLGHVNMLIAMVGAVCMPRQFDLTFAVVFAATLAASLGMTFGGGLLLLRWMRLLTPADERLLPIIRAAAAQVGCAAPTTYIAQMPAANALAFPFTGALAFSRGVLDCLDDAQLAAIAAHEICHLGMPTAQKIARLAQSLALVLPLLFVRPLWGQFGAQAIAPFLLGLFALFVLLQIFGKRMMLREEERADRAGAAVDEAAYARALERIYEQNLIPANWQSPQGHPPLYDRMVQSGLTPDFPRPRPPSRWRVIAALAAAMALFTLLTFALLMLSLWAISFQY